MAQLEALACDLDNSFTRHRSTPTPREERLRCRDATTAPSRHDDAPRTTRPAAWLRPSSSPGSAEAPTTRATRERQRAPVPRVRGIGRRLRQPRHPGRAPVLLALRRPTRGGRVQRLAQTLQDRRGPALLSPGCGRGWVTVTAQLRTVLCEECGRRFETKSARARFCPDNGRCRKAASRRARKGASSVERPWTLPDALAELDALIELLPGDIDALEALAEANPTLDPVLGDVLAGLEVQERTLAHLRVWLLATGGA